MPKEQISTRSIVLFYLVLGILLAAGIFAAIRNSYRIHLNLHRQQIRELKAPFPRQEAERRIAGKLKLSPDRMTPEQKKLLEEKLEEEMRTHREKTAAELKRLRNRKFLFLWSYPEED